MSDPINPTGKRDEPANQHRYPLGSTELLRTASGLLVPLSLAFGVFVYFKGHQTPGGGFVAGLVTAAALVVHRMAMGAASLNGMLPVPERVLIGGGLGLAVLTGVVPMFLGEPFLRSNFGYVGIGGGATLEWATVMLFDLGVWMLVTGVVVGMIEALWQENEA